MWNVCRYREIIGYFPFPFNLFLPEGGIYHYVASRKRYSCTMQALFNIKRYFVSYFCLTSLLAFSSLSFKNICAYECRGLTQWLLQDSPPYSPPEILALHTEASFLNKAVLGGKWRETGHADAIRQQDCRVRDHSCSPVFIYTKKKKKSQKCLVLGGDGAFKEKEKWTELNKEQEGYLWRCNSE